MFRSSKTATGLSQFSSALVEHMGRVQITRSRTLERIKDTPTSTPVSPQPLPCSSQATRKRARSFVLPPLLACTSAHPGSARLQDKEEHLLLNCSIGRVRHPHGHLNAVEGQKAKAAQLEQQEKRSRQQEAHSSGGERNRTSSAPAHQCGRTISKPLLRPSSSAFELRHRLLLTLEHDKSEANQVET